jgi:hypothetical protein
MGQNVKRNFLKLTLSIMEAYCVKCKAKREMNDTKEVSFKGKGGKDRPAMKGVCPKCSTTMFRILPSKK